MAARIVYDFIGIALSGTPQQLFTRRVMHWTLKANAANTATAYLTKSGYSSPNHYPMDAKDILCHGDFEKTGFEEYLDLTQLYVTGTSGDYLHLIVFYEDR